MHGFSTRKKKGKPETDFTVRRKVLLVFMLGAMGLLAVRAFDLQVLRKQFLKQQGDMRHVSSVSVSAYRGMILDRNGEPLAISTPVQSIWVNPQELAGAEQADIRQMEKLLDLPDRKINNLIVPGTKRRFVYVKRRINPHLAAQVKALDVPGVYFEREFKRYYPAGPVSAHLVGFTNVDDVGQEGIELAYDSVLRGTAGSKRVIRDGKRQIIGDVEAISAPIDGRNVQLSIDERIQYLAYRELQSAVLEHRAKAAALVVLDAKTGEVLADANHPAFNPNTRTHLKGSAFRNRAITDVFEPGSTVKPFVIAAALDGGYIKPDLKIETNGIYRIGRNVVRDVHNYGTLDLTHVLKKSSNVATSIVALEMPPDYFWGIYNQLGFGNAAGIGFPGEASGSVLDYQRWNQFAQATLSFGYGMNASVLQLARAYTALADNGVLHSVSLLKRDRDPEAKRVFSEKTAQSIRTMLEQVVLKDGTAYQARVDGYRVAGKTGTAKKAGEGGYKEKKYLSIFVGMAPASDPRVVIAVMVDEPSAGAYYGGAVAGPVFSKVMAGALRILDVAPDQEETMPVLISKTPDLVAQ
ncbi:peptidoglycan D,D-transpeptidase FtsI family protein [Methylotuvimicrobium alcaliphilum]|uniref:Peptidoglycan D,D-transpeptidase FtsI n=1 Tax=Methylotuvimicrobium alcaliphilum (strain DSM 19304 / NCIMB 14124 / VKM B-2133 / 20Z) TaxID=1091494 RepID=G4SWN9_META2|nr:penicillin-binding protein 2 [Methylotuvimicrobium alcaliphilum]CCE25265.1 Peptidoglycan glycosyltransferase [Methylotuvimicrobium alcaliphilum 20Z]